MTQKDKKLLLKELCARLPYGVKIELTNNGYHHENIAKRGDKTIDTLKGFTGKYFTIHHDNPLDWDWSNSEIEVEDIKPYLFPMESMNNRQKKYLDTLMERTDVNEMSYVLSPTEEYFDWLNEKHFDYRGLIEKGLAIDATGKQIY